MGTLVAIGFGVGLASVAGVRAFLPLALIGLSGALGLFGLPASLELLSEWPVVGTLFALALVKVPSLDPVLAYVQTPVRVVAGAMLFSTALLASLDVAEVPGLVAGAVIAGAIAISKVVLRPSQRGPLGGVSPSFLSLLEDVVALVAGIVAVFVPLLPLVFVAFLLFFFFRVRRRRGRKYGGLRILGD
jgi:hypothetical protein